MGRRARAGLAIAALATALALAFTSTPARAEIPPPPGGPILVVHGGDRFGTYLDEILRAEGLNTFATTDVGSLDAAALNGHQVVILGPATLTTGQVSALTSWVHGGGDLIAMRPDAKLTGLLGLAGSGGTLGDGYLRVDTASPPGAGITGATMQFHGTADRYAAAAGTRAIAMLYANSTTPTTSPAVTLRGVGGAGGQAAAFTYDLGRSVVLTHQGNPAWAGQERDDAVEPGTPTIRSSDLFFGGSSAEDYVNLDKVAIPQADEQQRLLANLITAMASDRLPMPRLWYLPRDARAAVVMTGDEHATGQSGTEYAFDRFKAQSAPGCSVADWQCVRATSYVFTSPSVAPPAAKAYENEGFEIALHLQIPGPNNCNDYGSYSVVKGALDQQLDGFLGRYSTLQPPTTIRTHCIVWSDWDSEVRADASRGIRLNTDYYYWPPGWVAGRSGMFTGAGFPMRYAATDGSVYDVYQATTQLPDETFMTGGEMAAAATTLLDGALGPNGYYGAFTANVHNDYATSAAHAPADAIVAAAQARGVPIISARQMLTWLDGRAGSSFRDVVFSDGRLRFTMAVGAGARGLRAMLPVRGPGGDLQRLTRNGAPVALTARTVKGVAYAVFDGAPGAYAATYASGGGGGGGGGGTVPVAPKAGDPPSAATPTSGASATPPASSTTRAAGDRIAPGLALGGATRQRAGGAIAITLRATTEDVWATASGTLTVPGRRRAARLVAVHNRFVRKGSRVTLQLKLATADRRAARRALRTRQAVKATITVRARDAAGNTTVRRRAVRLQAARTDPAARASGRRFRGCP